MCTFMGKAVVSRKAPNCLFTVGLQAEDLIACAIEAADLVLCLGYDYSENAKLTERLGNIACPI